MRRVKSISLSDLDFMLHAILGHVRIWWNSAGPDASFTRRPLRPEGFVHHVSADRPLVHPTLQWVESEVLPYRQFSEPPLLEVEIDDPIIRDLVTPLVDHGSARDIYGHNASDISDYLRSHLGRLFLYGRSFARIQWRSEGSRQIQTRTRARADGDSRHVEDIDGFVYLASEGVKPLGSADAPEGYEIDPSEAYRWGLPREHKDEPRYRLRPDQVLAFHWPLDQLIGDASPVRSLASDYWNSEVCARAELSAAYALANPQDRGVRAEVARLRNMQRLQKLHRIATASAHRKVGGSILVASALWPALMPETTAYYRAWQHIDALKRIVRMRDYLLDEFSRQVLQRLATRNGFSNSIHLRAVGLLTETDLDVLFSRFAEGELDLEALWKAARGRVVV